MIIGICGKKRHGKDTIGDYLVNNHSFIKLSFAEKLKDICRIMFDLDDEQLYGERKEEYDKRWDRTPRELLQFVGTDIIRKYFGKDFWINSVKRKIKSLGDVNVVICDVRFQNELNFVNEVGRCWKVERDLESVDEHVSEKGIDDLIGFECIIDNNGGLDDLYEKVEELISL